MERYNRHMCMALQSYCEKFGFSCVVISKNDRSFDPDYIKNNAEFKFIGCGGSKILFGLQYIKALITVKDLKLSIFGLLNHIPLALLMPRSIKKVSIIHGYEAWERLPAWKRKIVSKYSEFWSVSNYTRVEFSNLNSISVDRIKLLHNSLDYFWQRDDVGLSGEDSYILCVTRLPAEHGYYKGVDFLIRSFAKITTSYPKQNLVIVGMGDDVDRLGKLAVREGLADKVHFLGAVSDARLKKLYSKCTLFALPSMKEGFGIVFLEAMAVKKPVIGGNHGGTPEVIDDGKTGFLVKHSDEQELISVLDQLLASEELRTRMGNEGYRKLTECFLYSKFESTLFSHLSELMKTN